MHVLVTGPPSSGTRYVTRLLSAGGAVAVHLSQPDQLSLIEAEGLLSEIQGPQPDEIAAWFDMELAVETYDAVVVVTRGILAHTRSCMAHWRGMTEEQAFEWRRESLGRLAEGFGYPNVMLISYESLAYRAERVGLLEYLGLDPAGADTEQWIDMNAKHYAEEDFEWWGHALSYADDAYNSTRLNERCVEIPVARSWIPEDDSLRGLEVGNVLAHYGVTGHRVVDRHEVAVGVENLDVFDIEGEYDWIVAISTLEHVRWDESPKEYDGAMRALEYLRTLLAPGGKLLVTVPTGWHPVLDTKITLGETGASRSCTISRLVGDAHRWGQDDVVTWAPYGDRTIWASAVWIGEFEA